ncbi:SOS-response transcriptional repressor [gamma proteobacterium IMCC1989]|nr:SOS-response transcriptional repressor [gamma proteobacterium IMCC1989]
MKTLGLKGVDITKATGVSSGGVSQWVNGITKPNGAKLLALSKILQCQPDWLLYGKGDPKEYDTPSVVPISIQNRVPVISWVQAGEWTAIVDHFQPGDADEWQETTAKVGSNAFALHVQGDSMVNPSGSPSIPEGSIVIVDPDTVVDNGKIVVARLEESSEATLKKLVIDGPHRYLKPLNPDYRPIQINGNCTIVGVVRQVIFNL